MEAIQVQEEALLLATEIRRAILQFRREEETRRTVFESRIRALEERQELLEAKVAGGFILFVEQHGRPHLIKITGTATSLEEARIRAVGDCESSNRVLAVMAGRDWKVLKALAYAALHPTRTTGWIQVDAARVDAILTTGLDEGRHHLNWIRTVGSDEPHSHTGSDSDVDPTEKPAEEKPAEGDSDAVSDSD
jgi:hypothetical protein